MCTDKQINILQYDIVKRLTESYSAVRIKHLWGLIDHENKFLMRPVYDYIDIENGAIWARFRGEKFYIKNTDLPLRYDYTTKINDNHFLVTIEYRKGIIDDLGRIIIPTEYIDIRFYNNYYWCQKNGLEEYRIYSLSGKHLSEHYYKYIYDNPIIESNWPAGRKNIDYPIVQSENKFNVLNNKLEEVIPGKATLISRLERRQQKKKYGFEFEYVKSCFAVVSFNIGRCLYNFSTEEFFDIIYSKIDYKGKHDDGHEYVYCYRGLQRVCLEDYLNSSSNELINESTGIEDLDNYLNTEAYIKSHSSIVDIYNENGYLLTINIDENKIRSQLHDCTLICQKKSSKKYGVVSKLGIIVPYRYDEVYEGENDCNILIAQVGYAAKMNQSFFKSRKDINAECDIYNFHGKCISQGISLSEYYIVSENAHCFSIKSEHEFKYYNLDGDAIASSEQYSKINWFNAYRTTIAINKKGKYGIISDSGDVIAPFGYDEIFQTKISYNVYIGRYKRMYLYIFLSDNKIIVKDFRDVECPRSLDRDEELSTNRILFLVQDRNGLWGVFNSSLGLIIECQYKKDEIYIINQNLVIVASYGKNRICVDSTGQDIIVNEEIVNKMSRNGDFLYGLRNSTGIIITKEKYPQINEFENGFAVARNSKDLWGYLDLEGNELMPFIFTSASNMEQDGTAHIRTKDGFGIINNKGEYIITPNPKYKIYFSGEYQTDYRVISSDGKYGIVKDLRQILVPCLYDKIYYDTTSCRSGYVIVYNNGKAGVVNLEHPNGVIINCKYDKICLIDRNKYIGDYKRKIYQCFSEDIIDYYAQDGRHLFSINNIYDILLVTDDVIVYKDKSTDNGVTIKQDGVDDYICNDIGEYNTKYIQVYKNGAWGIYSIENKCETIPCVYYKSQEPSSWISPSNPFKYFIFDNSQSLVPIEKDGNYGYIDINNVIKIPTIYNSAKGFREGVAPIKVNDKWGYINHIGQVIIPFLFDDADLFYDGMACVKDGKTYGYFNINGDMIIPPLLFTEANRFMEGLARVEDERHWGYVTKDGTLVNWKEKKTSSCDYEDNEDWERESWYAMTDGMYGDYDGYCGDYDFLGR